MSKESLNEESFLDLESKVYVEAQMQPELSAPTLPPAKPFGVLFLILGVSGLFLSPLLIEGIRQD